MKVKIERRITDQCRGPGHGLPAPPFSLIKLFKPHGQDGLDELVPYLERMPTSRGRCPQPCQTDAQILQNLGSLIEWTTARPNPLNAQRRFSPTLGGSAVPICDMDDRTGAGDGR